MIKVYYPLYSFIKNAHGIINKNLSNIYLFPPLRVTFELTYKCNMNCGFCYLANQKYAAGGYRPIQEELNYAELIKIIDELPRSTLITFTGGEPFLRKDLLDILRCSTKKHKCTVITNGVLLNEDIIKELIKMKIPLIGISIDGLGRTHDLIRRSDGAFEKVIKNIELIQRHKKDIKHPMINLKCVINKENINQLSKLIDLAESLRIEDLTYQIIQTSIYYTNIGLPITHKKEYLKPPPKLEPIDTVALEKELEKIVSRTNNSKVNIRFIPHMPSSEILAHYSNKIDIRRYTCYSPWSMLRISPEGNVYPCYNYVIGNVRENSLKQLWNHRKFNEFREDFKKNMIFPGCIGCCLLKFKG